MKDDEGFEYDDPLTDFGFLVVIAIAMIGFLGIAWALIQSLWNMLP